MKQKQQVILLVILMLVAALVWGLERAHPSPAVQTAASIQNYKVLAVENPQIRWAELSRAQKTEYKSNGRNIFSTIAPPTAQEIRARDDAAKKASQPVPVPVPQAPTVATLPPNLKFFGYGNVPFGSARRAFFTDGDDIYIVSEGDTLLGRYRILKVNNGDLEFQEISSGLRGTAPLEEQAAPPSA